MFFNILAKARSFSKDSLSKKAKKFTKEEIANITTKKESGVWKEIDISDSGSTHNRGNLNNTLDRIHTKSNEFLQSGISRDTFLDLLKLIILLLLG